MSEIKFALSLWGLMWSDNSSISPEQDEGRDIENRFRKMSKGLKLF
jgi:hypothetical protein